MYEHMSEEMKDEEMEGAGYGVEDDEDMAENDEERSAGGAVQDDEDGEENEGGDKESTGKPALKEEQEQSKDE